MKREINAKAVILNELVWNAAWMLIENVTVLRPHRLSHT